MARVLNEVREAILAKLVPVVKAKKTPKKVEVGEVKNKKK